jgi:hypothetical protein
VQTGGYRNGTLNFATGAFHTSMYNVWTTDGVSVSVEELPCYVGLTWEKLASGGTCAAESGALVVSVVIGMFFMVIYHIETTYHQIVVVP